MAHLNDVAARSRLAGREERAEPSTTRVDEPAVIRPNGVDAFHPEQVEDVLARLGRKEHRQLGGAALHEAL
jgi:hypothetical protein